MHRRCALHCSGISRCGIASVCATCRTVIWLTTRLLSHRRHPALFARFDEANSRFAFAFAFRVGCARARALGRVKRARVYVCVCTSLCVRLPRLRRVCARVHTHRVRESLRMSLVTLEVTPGFALTIPDYQHQPPCTTDREKLHYALLTIYIQLGARDILSHVTVVYRSMIRCVFILPTWREITWDYVVML